MVPYSKELRRDVLAACDRGEGTCVIAFRFRCRESWVRRMKQERRKLGQTAPLTTRRRVQKWEQLGTVGNSIAPRSFNSSAHLPTCPFGS
jgi:hypothetical protein